MAWTFPHAQTEAAAKNTESNLKILSKYFDNNTTLNRTIG